jgi:hypothetical protein
MQRQTRLLTCLALAITLIAGAGDAWAKIYHWVDKSGTPHFSDRAEEVPAAYRDQIVDFEDELERSSRVNIIEGMNQPSPDSGPPNGEAFDYGAPPSGMPEVGQLPDFAADPTEMMQRVQGPMIAIVVVVGLLVLGFCFAFMTMALLLGCRMVGQESPGFKKAYGIVIVQALAGMVAEPGVVAVLGRPDIADMGGIIRLQAINLAVFLLIHSAVLRGMLCESMGKSIVLALVENLVVLGLGLLLGFGVLMCAGGAALLGAS